MSKYTEISTETEELFDKVLKKTSIPTSVEFKLFANNSLKDVYKLVKANEIWEMVTQGVNFVLLVNEVVLEQLEDIQKEMILEEAICGISVDLDKDKISTAAPDFTTYKGMIRKYGSEEMIRLKESIFAVLEQKEEKEQEEEA